MYPDGSINTIPASKTVREIEKGSIVVPSKDKGNMEDPTRDHNGQTHAPARTRGNNQQASNNVKTGVGSASGLFGVIGAAAAGLFATKKKEEEEDK